MGAVPQFGRGVELGGRVWYPVKLLHIRYNLIVCWNRNAISLRLQANRNTHFALGDQTVPQF